MPTTYAQLLEISDKLKKHAADKAHISDEGKFLTQDLTPEEHKALKKHLESGDCVEGAAGAKGALGSAHKKVFARTMSNAYFHHCKHKAFSDYKDPDDRISRSKAYRDSDDWESAAQEDHAHPALCTHYGVKE